MSSFNTVGGFFELELGRGKPLHSGAIALSSGRSCFEYALRVSKAKHIHLPKYTCDAMLEPLQRLGVPYSFYSINEKLEIKNDIELRDSDFLVYTNYFGVKDIYARELSQKYGERLVLDCSQAFYSPPSDRGFTFYSPRKFFGVPDGGYLYSSKKLDTELPMDHSVKRSSHLLMSLDVGPEAAYSEFKVNDRSLTGQPIMQMSHLTQELLAGIDYGRAKNRRIENFNFLSEHLGQTNAASFLGEEFQCPMTYPYITDSEGLRQELIDQKIFVATYWPNVLEWCTKNELEYSLAKKLLPLPLDQRYEKHDMERIVEAIN